MISGSLQRAGLSLLAPIQFPAFACRELGQKSQCLRGLEGVNSRSDSAKADHFPAHFPATREKAQAWTGPSVGPRCGLFQECSARFEDRTADQEGGEFSPESREYPTEKQSPGTGDLPNSRRFAPILSELGNCLGAGETDWRRIESAANPSPPRFAFERENNGKSRDFLPRQPCTRVELRPVTPDSGPVSRARLTGTSFLGATTTREFAPSHREHPKRNFSLPPARTSWAPRLQSLPAPDPRNEGFAIRSHCDHYLGLTGLGTLLPFSVSTGKVRFRQNRSFM